MMGLAPAMLRGRVALASVYLCCVCLLGLVAQLAAKPCSLDITKKVEILIGKAPELSWLDCRLYTPTADDFLQNCPRSTLKCFADELQVLIEEWGLHGFRKFKLSYRVKGLAPNLNQTDPACLQCELLKEEEAGTFLGNLLQTIQMANQYGCR